MDWIKFEELEEEKFEVRGSPPQYLEFPCDVTGLAAEIPTEAHFEKEGFIQGPTLHWYARAAGRPLIIEHEDSSRREIQRVFIHTSYLPIQDRSGDWTVLLDLLELPKSIPVMHPTFILSRTTHPKNVVYRPQAAGWNSVIYYASSLTEAEQLLAFLTRDSFNEACFIGPPEPEGLWSATRNEDSQEKILCTYLTRNAALSFACTLSLQDSSKPLLVKDRSHNSSDQYFVSGGKVVDRLS